MVFSCSFLEGGVGGGSEDVCIFKGQGWDSEDLGCIPSSATGQMRDPGQVVVLRLSFPICIISVINLTTHWVLRAFN